MRKTITIDIQLAINAGLNEALFLAHLEKLLAEEEGDYALGNKWIKRTIKEWQDELVIFSYRKVVRTTRSLRDKNLISVEQLSNSNGDSTNYYTINYDKYKEYKGEFK